jgi:hypothetical protein
MIFDVIPSLNQRFTLSDWLCYLKDVTVNDISAFLPNKSKSEEVDANVGKGSIRIEGDSFSVVIEPKR